MCGLTGMFVTDGLGPDDRAEVDALNELVARRGPDDAGTWSDRAHCALGFRRLSILDLSVRGHQPMVSADGENVLVCNGEVYNFRALRRELEAAGRHFRSTSDTEVVLEALAHWGFEALARLEGMFALAWYRPRSRRLVLARDPIGIKPLHWWSTGGTVVFGSQYDQVVRHRRCDRSRVDQGALRLYLRLGVLPAPYGLLEHTGQVEPGHALEISADAPRLRARPFRPLPTPVPPADRLSGVEADDAVAAAVAGAVERQLVSDVPVGVFLSGGIDSPLVAAAAGSVTGRPTPAFSIGTDDPAMDESVPAAAYAEAFGLDHHLRRITGPEALGLVDDVAQANTEPFGDYSSFPTLMVSALAAGEVKTVLSGDGGDELFWGYPRFAKVRRSRRWFRLPRAARAAAYGATKPFPTHRRPARGILFSTLGDWYLDAHSGLRDADLDRLTPALRSLPAGFDRFRLDGVPDDDGLLQWMRANELACHLPMILQKVDRASMFHSLEVRVPLLDRELVELAMRIDPSAALVGADGKLVLRRALARRVPPETIPRSKRGFTVPLGRWLRDDLEPLVRDLLGPDAFPAGAFAAGELDRFYEEHRCGRRDHTRGLWNLVALQLWARTHLLPLGAHAGSGPT